MPLKMPRFLGLSDLSFFEYCETAGLKLLSSTSKLLNFMYFRILRSRLPDRRNFALCVIILRDRRSADAMSAFPWQADAPCHGNRLADAAIFPAAPIPSLRSRIPANELRARLRYVIRYGFGAWRSLVAHLPWEQGVAGSIPVSPTSKFKGLQFIL